MLITREMTINQYNDIYNATLYARNYAVELILVSS